MRKKIAAGNWKMNTNLQEGIALASELNKMVATEQKDAKVGVVIGVPFTHISEIVKVVDSSKVVVAAQNCASEAKGAYTGEISASMLKSLGVGAVIIGHSERRSYYKEDDATLLKKVNLSLENGLQPIFCCGELLAERDANQHFAVVKSQIESVLFQLNDAAFAQIVIAYEPVWAIGTGRTASPQQAQEMHAFIRETIASKFGKAAADNTSILYGGSCNGQNAQELFANPDVDGGLVGGASLKAGEFMTIINSF